MNVNDIIKLLDAGYTREEINALHEAEQTAGETEQPGQPEQAPASAGLDANAALVELLGKMDRKITEIQAMNILSMQQPGGQDQQKTPEDVLSELMHPNDGR